MSDALRAELQQSLGAGFTIVRELGGGGMARVFLTRDDTLGRDIAVKVLAPDLAEGLSSERFTREIRLAAALQDPHIVPVHAAGTTASGLPYFTMPYVHGESLRHRLERGPVSESEATSILRDIARALSYAHRRGIVHRDIKPENILLSEGSAVVADFGIAKAMQLSRTNDRGRADALTRTGTSLGTPAYMAPEQAAGDPSSDHRADLYAWGVVAYELLAGQHPFHERTSPQQMMAAHFGDAPPSLTSKTGASRAVTELVMRALAKEPSQRPASADEIVRVLSGIAATGARRPIGRSVLVAAAVVIAAVSGGAWWATRAGTWSAAAGDAQSPIMLAVLPFTHSGPVDQQSLTDGLTDAVTAKLGALDVLGVIDPHSAEQYRGTTKTAKQIGSELGVRYLVEGVVRWARDGSGAWRARMTPTLVDANEGVTRWSGDAVEIPLADPFGAQTTIATDVVNALKVQLQPQDRARLSRNYSTIPDALVAFDRGLAILNEARRRSARLDRDAYQRALIEIERAIALDSSFGFAWATLYGKTGDLAALAPGDTGALSRFHRARTAAIRYAGDNGLVLVERARDRITDMIAGKVVLVNDTVGADSLIQLAEHASPNDAFVLQNAGAHWISRGRIDRGLPLIKRSAALDPRNPRILEVAATYCNSAASWDDAIKYANALAALDSTDERGWTLMLTAHGRRGDSSSVRRDLVRALRAVPRPSRSVLLWMPDAGDDYARQFLVLSADRIGITTLYDSVSLYYNVKAEVLLDLGDDVRARIYSDSVRRLLTGRVLPAAQEDRLLMQLAFAQAHLGLRGDARKTLDRVLSVARAKSAQDPSHLPNDRLSRATMAGIYARLGEPDEAIRWLEATKWAAENATPRALAQDPKLQLLTGTPQFARYLRAHPEPTPRPVP